jgi:hypothetical protein
LLLAFASAFILVSESRGTRTIFYSLRFETFLFVAFYDSQGYVEVFDPAFTGGIYLSGSNWSKKSYLL